MNIGGFGFIGGLVQGLMDGKGLKASLVQGNASGMKGLAMMAGVLSGNMTDMDVFKSVMKSTLDDSGGRAQEPASNVTRWMGDAEADERVSSLRLLAQLGRAV